MFLSACTDIYRRALAGVARRGGVSPHALRERSQAQAPGGTRTRGACGFGPPAGVSTGGRRSTCLSHISVPLSRPPFLSKRKKSINASSGED